MLKVLVATKDTQGRRKNDFSWVDEGEPVCFGMECDGETIDGSCGCRRALCGMVSHTATTTFKVIEYDMTEAEYFQSLTLSLYEGWGDMMGLAWCEDRAKADGEELLSMAHFFPVGTVLEKRGNKFKVRENGK